MEKERLLKVVIDNRLGKELAQLLYDTKKEVFDDLEDVLHKEIMIGTASKSYKELKKRHLSTFKKKGT